MAASRSRSDRQDDTRLPDDATEEERREAGDRLRERIYATFTALAILLALSSHAHTPEAQDVLWTLVISVCGVLLAGLASDLVSHMIVHNTLPTGREFRHMVAVASRALGVLVLPAIMLGLAAFDVIETQTALTVSLISLIASLVVIVWLAVRRTGLSGGKQLIVLAAIVALGVGVVLLEQLAH
ncbi:hypothetical protein ACFVWR_15950 [Leifsonia sp. NPDC058292]|uniref:hypothetical protein n=1 Tax=Leifsonia sp. NPDC058292 TaxID=3346428 RepID=UPI0036DE623C